MTKALIATLLLLFCDASAGESLTTTQLAATVDKSKREAEVASENLRIHLAQLLSRYRAKDGAGDCLEYGWLLRRSAADRIWDADLVMTAITNEGPPSVTQRFSAAVIYLAAKRDLEKAVLDADKCFAAGGPFK